MLGNLFTMLCVSDVDGKLIRVDCGVREGGKSNAPKDMFNNEAAEAAAATAVAAAAAAADDIDGDAIADIDDDDAAADNDGTGNGPVVMGANADDFVRLLSNDSLAP